MTIFHTAISGNLTNDPVIKMDRNNKEYATFTVALKAGGKESSGEDLATFINCILFGTKAIHLKEYAKKGTQIYASGRMKQNNFYATAYTKSGEKVTVWTKDFELKVDSFELGMRSLYKTNDSEKEEVEEVKENTVQPQTNTANTQQQVQPVQQQQQATVQQQPANTGLTADQVVMMMQSGALSAEQGMVLLQGLNGQAQQQPQQSQQAFVPQQQQAQTNQSIENVFDNTASFSQTENNAVANMFNQSNQHPIKNSDNDDMDYDLTGFQ